MEKTGKDLEAGYQRALARLDAAIVMVQRAGHELRFALPHEDVGIIAGIDQVLDTVPRSPAARAILEGVILSAPPEEVPTVLMLEHVLMARGISIERVSLTELGYEVGAS